MSSSAGKRARKPIISFNEDESADEELQVKKKQARGGKKGGTKKATTAKKGRGKKKEETEPAATTQEGQETKKETVGQGPIQEQAAEKPGEGKEEEQPQSESVEAVSKEVETQLEKPQEKWLEKGHIYFFYRPKVEVDQVTSIDEVQRLYILLIPTSAAHKKRLIILAKKRLPDVHRHSRFWGFVEKASDDLEDIHRMLDPESYPTQTRGERHVGAARPAGEGFYGLIRHERGHTHLVYILELPEELGEVQKGFNIGKEGSFIIAVKNPSIANPSFAGLQPEKKAHYPAKYQEKFEDKRWIPAYPPDLLDFDGAEIIFIGATEDIVAELGDSAKELEKDEAEDLKKLTDNSLYQELRIGKKTHPAEPLLQGIWK